jgi:hypothetical protein
MNQPESIKPTHPILLALFWLYVAMPLSWGIWSTIKKALALFN